MHHIAFAVDDRAAQLEVRKALMDTGYQVTPVIDRDYFWALYFPTPRGVLFEIATNEPGFDRDEDTAHLCGAVKLPTRYEPYRDQSKTDQRLTNFGAAAVRVQPDGEDHDDDLILSDAHKSARTQRAHRIRFSWDGRRRVSVRRADQANPAGCRSYFAARGRIGIWRAALLSSDERRLLRHGGPDLANRKDGQIHCRP
ncbi:hypothetical protein GOC29_16950 [Sinorhizobium meliloti]|nr:hypothetical protein [Sinorhizobium meliloti]MDX0116481.1 hypothetical protein [Sinorhizobium meliloti]MDX0132429.1 hypothetical protein [Sinorhizobium meliloti]